MRIIIHSFHSTELEKIKDRVLFYVDEFYRKYPDLIFDYNSIDNYEKLTKLEIQQQNLIYSNFEIRFHLFVKYYSGT